MYKVFLVEDEIIVREGIRNSIPWDNTPYSFAGEAPDGEMALAMIQEIKPDILITDIRMPFMDGLTLSRIVKKTLPWVKIIILSGHDEFEYARDAISVGVEEYLLKPVSAQDMLKTLNKIAGRIDEEKEKFLSIENLKARLRTSAEILRDAWLLDLLNGRVPPELIIEKGREFGVDFPARSYIVIATEIVNPPGKEAQLVPVKIIMQNIMEKYPNGIWFPENETRYVIILKEASGGEDARTALVSATGISASGTSGSGGQGVSAADSSVEGSAYAIAQAFKYDVERNTECRVAVGIGPAIIRISEAEKSYAAARKILNRCVADGLFQIADSSLLPGDEDSFDPSWLPNIDGDVFLTKLKYAGKKDIDSIIGEYTKALGNNFTDNHIMRYFIFGEIMVAVSKLAEALQGDIKKISPFSLNQEDIRHIISSRELFLEKVKALLDAVIEYRDAHTSGRYREVIVKAREYIDRNFASADMSLYSTASHVGISPNHLSTVFTQETGENFIDYLTRVRIERAKQLLRDTAMKSAEISGETGFNDPHYFSYIFKKNTGLSPREYRLSKAQS